jgi:hypothetical protein
MGRGFERYDWDRGIDIDILLYFILYLLLKEHGNGCAASAFILVQVKA